MPQLIDKPTVRQGDQPGRVRIVVEEKSGADQKGLIWGFRSRYLSTATTAKADYSATELQLLGEAAKEAVTGATGGTAVSNNALPAVWTPVVGTNLGGTTWLTHQGTYRVFARLRSPQGAAVSARMVWDVGDLVYPTENSAWTFPAGSAWFVADLGEMRLQAPPVGTYRWQGQIQAKGTQGGEDINVDRVWFVNEDEGMGVLSAPPQASSSQETIKAWDNFNATTAGTITGKVAPLGGTWTGAGDAVGFAVNTGSQWIERSEIIDVNVNTGYYARLGTATLATCTARLDTYVIKPGASTTSKQGLFLRYTNESNWLMAAYFWPGELATKARVRVYKRVGGAVTELGESGDLVSSEGWRSLEVQASATGAVTVREGAVGSGLSSVASISDSALATGGTLASGGFGIYDALTSAAVRTRRYDNFSVTAPSVSVPTEDAVVYASRIAQLTTKGMFRTDSGGTAYGPISRVIGDLPRMPAGGLEGRSTELFIKASRGDFDQVADSAIDDIAVKVFVSRSWLTVPGTI